MGYDANTAERVRRVLSGRDDIVEKRMVGVTSTALMVRVGPEAYQRALA
jgi:hypothetical protein